MNSFAQATGWACSVLPHSGERWHECGVSPSRHWRRSAWAKEEPISRLAGAIGEDCVLQERGLHWGLLRRSRWDRGVIRSGL